MTTEMTYQDALDFLYHETKSFETMGGDAYKPGLERVDALLSLCDNPHQGLRMIHVAGTNGKGSVSSLIASVLQASGYRVGLFTSPHLIDFRERIRVNGEMISEKSVVKFVEFFAPLIRNGSVEPSFFELTTAMAFSYFREQQVDYAVIEVGMGGRLDSTNVITPMVSVITNVSLDHTQYLGNTLEAIAREKAGIIKPLIPVVLGRSQEREVRGVIEETAQRLGARLVLADRVQEIMMFFEERDTFRLSTIHFGSLTLPLLGSYQIENASTALQALLILKGQGLDITEESVQKGFREVSGQGLRARLEVIQETNPRIVIDAGHNPASWVYLSGYLEELVREREVICILGFSEDKDIDKVFSLLPRNLTLLFSNAHTDRAKKAKELREMAEGYRFRRCRDFDDVADAFRYALDVTRVQPNSTIFVGGSFYLVGEFLRLISPKK